MHKTKRKQNVKTQTCYQKMKWKKGDASINWKQPSSLKASQNVKMETNMREMSKKGF